MQRISKFLSPRRNHHKDRTPSKITGNRHKKDPTEETHCNDPTSSDIPGNERKKEYMPTETQWSETFEESLRDFQLRFEKEETARSMGEHARQNEFYRTMKNFQDISQRNHLRRQDLCKETEALQEERFQRADAAREAIFVQGQQNRARAFEADREMREKRAEWYSTVRKELLKDGHQRLAEKHDALNAALMNQFDRLTKRQEEMMEVVKEQSSQDTLVPVPPDRNLRPVDSQLAVSSLRPSWSQFPNLHVEGLNSLTQLTSPKSGQEYTRISHSQYPSSRNLQASSSSHPESLDSFISPASTEFDDKQEQWSRSIKQGNSEESIQSGSVEEDKIHSSFIRFEEQRQAKFLRSESERDRRFHASEATRENAETKRSTVFNKKLKHWEKTEQFRGREEERFGREIQRSNAFRSVQGECLWVFHMSMSHIQEQAKAEADLETIWFDRQKDAILTLCKSQAIQLDQYITADQVVWFESMRGKYCHIHLPGTAQSYPRLLVNSTSSCKDIQLTQHIISPTSMRKCRDDFAPDTLVGGGFIQAVLPIPQVTNHVKHNEHETTNMQKMFEQSQQLRAEAFEKGAKERGYIFTINEAKREAEFLNVQQIRQETFDEAEELRESGFEEAQRQREAKFQANERKREDDFNKNEAERMDEARREQEDREQQFRSTMMALQRKCIDDIERRLKEVESFGEELMMRREPGLKIMDISWHR